MVKIMLFFCLSILISFSFSHFPYFSIKSINLKLFHYFQPVIVAVMPPALYACQTLIYLSHPPHLLECQIYLQLLYSPSWQAPSLAPGCYCAVDHLSCRGRRKGRSTSLGRRWGGREENLGPRDKGRKKKFLQKALMLWRLSYALHYLSQQDSH